MTFDALNAFWSIKDEYCQLCEIPISNDKLIEHFRDIHLKHQDNRNGKLLFVSELMITLRQDQNKIVDDNLKIIKSVLSTGRKVHYV